MPDTPTDTLFVYGFPGLYAGANTELHHQIILWRSMGLDVHLIPTDSGYRNEPLYPEMVERGVIVHEPNQFDAILPGAPVFGFCNDRFLGRIDEVLRYSHNTVFVNCMTWLFELEKQRHREGKIAAFLYQNETVRQKNVALLQAINSDPGVHYLAFRPYFDAGAFPFVEHRPADRFTIGRISRQDADKFSADTLRIWKAIEVPDSLPGAKQGIMLGFGRPSEDKIGKPPDWITTHENQRTLSQQDFYSQVDVIVQPMDTTENWPRIGLEAMASGAVLIVDNRGGWRQMVEHGVTGWLCDTLEDFIMYATRMAHEPEQRRAMAYRARERLHQLAGSDASTESWGGVFDALGVGIHRQAGSPPHQPVPAVTGKQPKVIVGALSCRDPRFAQRRLRCQRTWLAPLEASGVEVVFLVGVGDRVCRPTLVGPASGRPGTELHLPCPDDYASLPQKTRWFCRWASENRSFDFLFKCDDDTYIVADRFLAMLRGLPDGVEYLGNEWMAGTDYASGGAGYLLGPRAAELVARHLTQRTGAEDLLVGKLLRESGVRFHRDHRFVAYANEQLRPLPGNDLITAHACGIPWEAYGRTWPEDIRQAPLASTSRASTDMPAMRFFSNLYLVNHARGFKAVCISKNACTTLKWLTLRDDDPQKAGQLEGAASACVHDALGYQANGSSLIDLNDHRWSEYTRFAVYRDPWERLVSTYRNKVMGPRCRQGYYSMQDLDGASFDRFMEFVEKELAKPSPCEMDEHIRPQSGYYDPDRDVDVVVPIEALDDFLAIRFGVGNRAMRRNAADQAAIDELQVWRQRHWSRVRQLYAKDYELAEWTTTDESQPSSRPGARLNQGEDQ